MTIVKVAYIINSYSVLVKERFYNRNMGVYNENRDKNQNMRDEIREQNAKLKGAPMKDKLAYFKEYYLKTSLLILAVAVFIIALIHSMLSGPQDTVFAALFYNDTGDSSDTTLADNFAAYMGIDTSKHDVYIDATMSYHDTSSQEISTEPATDATEALNSSMFSYDDYVGLEKAMALVAAKELDVIAGDDDVFNYYCKAEVFADLRDIFTKEELETYKDRLCYYENAETGESVPYGIDITDSPEIQKFHYYDGIHAILGFVVNSQNPDNAKAFLNYIDTAQ